MKYYGRLSVAALLAIAPLYGFAQEKVVPIKYGDMDQWICLLYTSPSPRDA